MLFFSPHVIYSLRTFQIRYVWVKKQQLLSENQSPDNHTVPTLDLGLNNICSGMCRGVGSTPLLVFPIDISVGPLCWSSLDYVGLFLP